MTVGIKAIISDDPGGGWPKCSRDAQDLDSGNRLRRAPSEVDDQNLIFVMMDDFIQSPQHQSVLERRQVTTKHAQLYVFTEAVHRSKHLAPPFR